MPAPAGHLPTNFSKRLTCLPQERSELKALAFWIGVAVSRTKSTMQCPGFSSGVSPGKEMEMSMTEIAKRLGLTPPAVSIVTRRGEKIDILSPK